MGKEKGNLKKICDQGITIELGFNIKKKRDKRGLEKHKHQRIL